MKKPGDRVLRARDLATCLGVVLLVGNSKDELFAQLERLRELELTGCYSIVDELEWARSTKQAGGTTALGKSSMLKSVQSTSSTRTRADSSDLTRASKTSLAMTFEHEDEGGESDSIDSLGNSLSGDALDRVGTPSAAC